jgi:hypothetical protein
VSEPFLDEAGEKVVRFMGEARNLSRLGELTDEVVAIAESGAWRTYRTALGTERWLECELDYFLISCDLSHEDVSRVLAYTRKGGDLAAMMDREANSGRRRTLAQASEAWRAPTPETLLERARRLGWTRGETEELRSPPLSPRVRARQAHGGSLEENARNERARRISARRRRELDVLARRTQADVVGPDELRYLVDQLGKLVARGPGRPAGDHEQWAKDVAEFGGDTGKLAERWGVSDRAARKRKAELKSRNMFRTTS